MSETWIPVPKPPLSPWFVCMDCETRVSKKDWDAHLDWHRIQVARLADVEVDRDTWSNVANKMMHERNAARTALADVESENERLRDGLYLHWTSGCVTGQSCRGCGNPRGGWPDPQPGETEHSSSCWVAALATTPAATAGGSAEEI